MNKVFARDTCVKSLAGTDGWLHFLWSEIRAGWLVGCFPDNNLVMFLPFLNGHVFVSLPCFSVFVLFFSISLSFSYLLSISISNSPLSLSLFQSLREVQFGERMWGTAGPHHFSLRAWERRSWQSDAQSLSLLMTAPFSIIITIIRKLGGQKVFTVNLPPPKER